MSKPLTALGFLSIQHDAGGWFGGYLVTNLWGRPLEFRLTSAVNPNRIQQILYGQTLAEYVCAEVIGKALFDKTSTTPQLLLTDEPAAVALRALVHIPTVWVSDSGPAHGTAHASALATLRDFVAVDAARRPALQTLTRFADDAPLIADLLGQLGNLDLAEPFHRIREAVTEARRLGAGSRP
jgi:hypothetical protein